MYTLNLLFDFTRTNGRFSGDATTTSGALSTSMNWLRLKTPEPSNPNPPTFNPEAPAIWTDLKEATGTLLLQMTPDPGNICIRIAPDPDVTAPPADLKIQLVVCFGRPVKARQPQASPFTVGGEVRTTFLFGPIARNSPNGAGAAGNVAWFFNLGKMQPQTLPGDRNRTHRFEFALGVIATSGPAGAETIRHFGEDPEMDIGD